MTLSRWPQVIELYEHRVGHGVRLQVSPDVLRGIQFRGIGRQELRLPTLFPADMICVGGLRKEADFGQGGVEGGKGVIMTPAEVLQERKHRPGVDIGLGMKAEEQLDAVPSGETTRVAMTETFYKNWSGAGGRVSGRGEPKSAAPEALSGSRSRR